VPTITGLTAAPNPATFGGSVTLTAFVAASPASAGTPIGSVTFLDGSTVLGTATLASVSGQQQATLTVPGLGAGTHTLKATYSGNATFAGSTSITVAEVLQRAASHLVARSFITDSPSFPPGLQIYGTVQATLTGNGGAALAGETIVFSTTQVNTDGQTIHICTAVTDSDGVATCDATTLFPASTLDGGFDVTFNGSASYAPATVHQPVNDR
jgi:Big-like domain-containing protein